MSASGHSCSNIERALRADAARALLRPLALGLIAFALMAILAGPAAAATQTAPGTASVAGTVTDGKGKPIATEDVCVRALPTFLAFENEEGLEAKTDASGEYLITGLPAGSYKVYFADCEGSARNDLPQYYNDQSTYAAAQTLKLGSGERRTGIDAALQPATTISGHVYGGAGGAHPLQGICVDASPATAEYGYAFTQTAADGSYTLSHVAPAIAYSISFYDCRQTPEYLTRFYDEAGEPAGATTVTAKVGEAVGAIDAHLEKGASISGMVKDAQGQQIASEDVCVTAAQINYQGGYGQNGYGSAVTGADGSYTIGALAPGTYEVYFSDCYTSKRNDMPQYYDHQTSPTFAEPITLTAGQAETGIDATLEPATTISGHVYGGAGDSTPLVGVCVSAIPSTYTGGYAYTETDAEGAYTLGHIIPGASYEVEFYPCKNPEYLSQYYGASGSATRITPTSAPLTGIDGHLEKGASISGTVSDAQGQPVTGEDVCVVAEQSVSTRPFQYPVGYATTNASGQYSVVGLAPGSYKVYFYDCRDTRNDQPQYYDGATEASAASLVVLAAGGAQTGIDAELQPATSISGHVYAGSGGTQPLAGICVESATVSEEGLGYLYDGYATSEADGSYTIDHLTPGSTYRVVFLDCNSRRRYLTQYYNDATYATASSLTPTIAEPATGIDAHMEEGASISGTVSDAQGMPITTGDVCVDVYPSSYASYSENDYGYASTGASGEYTVGALAPGSYDVRFEDCYYGDTRRNDLRQYYHDQTSAAAAEAVTLGVKQELTGIDAELQPATSITGHVYAGPGETQPLAGICVEAFRADEEFSSGVSSAYTAYDGSYTLLHLEPSVGYKVEFYDCFDSSAYEVQFYEGAGEIGTAKVVTPTGSPASGIDAHLAADPLQITITGGPANGAATNATEASFAFTAPDARARFQCALDGGAYSSCNSPITTAAMNGGQPLADGQHRFSVLASDEGKTGPAKTIFWTVDTGGPTSTSSGSLAAGETFSSDPGQSPSSATSVLTEVTAPVAASITLTDEPTTTPSTNGYTVFGQQIDIAAIGSGGSSITTSETEPIVLAFTLAASEVPAGTELSEITVMRNGAPAGECATKGVANPNPCVASRMSLPDGGVQLTVLTTHCSLWNFALAKTEPGEEHEPGEKPEPGEKHEPGEEHEPGEKPGLGEKHEPNEPPVGGGGQGGATGNSTPLAGPPSSSAADGGILANRVSHPASRPETRSQKLAHAIAACRRLPRGRRKKCVAAARKRFARRPVRSHKRR